MCDANVLLTPQQETETIGMGKSYVRQLEVRRSNLALKELKGRKYRGEENCFLDRTRTSLDMDRTLDFDC